MATAKDVGQTQQFSVRDFLQGYEIPTLPEVFFKCLKCARDEKSSDIELARLIATDEGIGGKVLERAGGTLSLSPVQAVSKLGRERIIGILLAASIETNLRHINPQNISLKDHWVYSTFVGCAVQNVCVKYSLMTEVDPFSVGVLHNVGELVMLDHIDAGLAQKLMEADTVGERLEIEKEVLGFTHQQLTIAIMKDWNLPIEYYLAMRSSYAPPVDTPSQLEQALAMAIHIVQLDAFDCPNYWQGVDAEDKEYLNDATIAQIYEKTASDLNEYIAIMGI